MSRLIRKALAPLLMACLAVSISAASPRGADRLAFALTGARVIVAPDMRSRVVGAYLDGRALDLTDKQKRLYERYRNRPKPAAPAASKAGQ